MNQDLAINTIHLHGALGDEFGGPFTLAVATPIEAVNALCRLLPGFQERLNEDGVYRVIRGSEQAGMDLGQDELDIRLPGEMHLVPVPAGAGGGSNGTVKTIAGVALVALAAYMTFGVGAAGVGTFFGASSATAAGVGTSIIGFTASMGLSLVMTGVSMMLSPQPRAGNTGADPNSSYLFYGNMNVVDQGVPVPLVFGRTRTGSIIVSSGLDVDEAPPIQAPTTPDPPPGQNETGSTGSNTGEAVDPYAPVNGAPDP